MDWVRAYRGQLRLAVRITAASLLTFVVCHILGLKQGPWAVLTAIIVMQSSLGGSIKAAFDRFVGSVGGAVWGVLILLLLPHRDLGSVGLALLGALAPLALLAALRPAYRVAPITAVILLLTPGVEAAGPLSSAEQRLIEIGIGSLVALAVAIFILPARAHTAAEGAASRALHLMADLMDVLAKTMAGKPQPGAALSLQASIRKAIAEAEAAAEEAVHERRNYLASGPDPQPLCRTLRRLRNDVSMIGRAIAAPEPGSPCTNLDKATVNSAEAIAAFLRTCAEALARGEWAPSLSTVDDRIREQGEAIAALRRSGATRDLAGDAVSGIFGLAFSFQQLHRNLRDLVARTNELTLKPRPVAAARPQ